MVTFLCHASAHSMRLMNCQVCPTLHQRNRGSSGDRSRTPKTDALMMQRRASVPTPATSTSARELERWSLTRLASIDCKMSRDRLREPCGATSVAHVAASAAGSTGARRLPSRFASFFTRAAALLNAPLARAENFGRGSKIVIQKCAQQHAFRCFVCNRSSARSIWARGESTGSRLRQRRARLLGNPVQSRPSRPMRFCRASGRRRL